MNFQPLHRYTYHLLPLSQDHPQFTTKTVYTFTAPVKNDRKIFTCRLADPAPPMPDGFELEGFEEVKPDSYVLVDAASLKIVDTRSTNTR